MTNNERRRGEFLFALTFFFIFPFFSINTAIAQEVVMGALSDTIPVDEDRIPKEIEGSHYQIEPDLYFTYQKPKFWDLINKAPHNALNTLKDFVAKPYYPYGIAALGATAALIPADPWLIQESRSLGEQLGFSSAHTYKKLGFLKIVPADVNSALYFIGNGTTFILISSGLATYGLITDDYRAKSTAMQLIESILVTGVFVQPIKRLTGRESPFITEENGRWHSSWHFAPSFAAYQRDTPHYDAMPSGHLTTAMAAVTVLAENYKDYKWIKPVSYTALALMSFEMMQSKVHWASDYPIALFMGYLIGKNIAKSRIEISDYRPKTAQKYHWNLSSSTAWDGTPLYGVFLSF